MLINTTHIYLEFPCLNRSGWCVGVEDLVEQWGSFTLEQNCKYSKLHYVNQQILLHMLKINIWNGFTATFITGPVFFEESELLSLVQSSFFFLVNQTCDLGWYCTQVLKDAEWLCCSTILAVRVSCLCHFYARKNISSYLRICIAVAKQHSTNDKSDQLLISNSMANIFTWSYPLWLLVVGHPSKAGLVRTLSSSVTFCHWATLSSRGSFGKSEWGRHWGESILI